MSHSSADVPPEVLFEVVQCILWVPGEHSMSTTSTTLELMRASHARSDPWLARRTSMSYWEFPQLQSCSLVCKSWFRDMLPLIYSFICLDSSCLDCFLSHMRWGSPIRLHAKKVALVGKEARLACAEICRLLPNLIEINFLHDGSSASYVLPFRGTIVANCGATNLFCAVRFLTIRTPRFASTVDLFRLIQSLPRLSTLGLKSIVIHQISPVVPRNSTCDLTTVICEHVWAPHVLVRCLAWPHPSRGFNGLQYSDAKLVGRILGCTSRNLWRTEDHVVLSLDMSLNSDMWVISVLGAYLDVEVFVQQYPVAPASFTSWSQVRHILLRPRGGNDSSPYANRPFDTDRLHEILASIDECCSQLTDLESIVLEEARHRADEILVEKLPHARCQLIQTTYNGRNAVVTSHSSDDTPLPPSPFWTLDKFSLLRRSLGWSLPRGDSQVKLSDIDIASEHTMMLFSWRIQPMKATGPPMWEASAFRGDTEYGRGCGPSILTAKVAAVRQAYPRMYRKIKGAASSNVDEGL